MIRIKENSIDDILHQLPEWTEATDIALSAQLLICALGFEERSDKNFARWAKANPNSKSLWIIYPYNEDDNARMRGRFQAAADRYHIQVTEIRYNPNSFFGEICEYLKATIPSLQVIIDISSIASFVFFPLFAALRDAAEVSAFKLKVVYTEAVDYSPSKEEWDRFSAECLAESDLVERARLFDEKHFQSAGVDEIYESSLFPGMNVDKLPSVGVILPNFSYDRVTRMKEFCRERMALSDDKFHWLIGRPPNDDKNGWRFDAIVDLYGRAKKTCVPISTFNYKDAVHALHEIWTSTRLSESMVIATVGSKAQHLATFLFLLMHQEVSLVLSEPSKFVATRYSSAAGKSYLLDFGNLSDLSNILYNWNKIDYSWKDKY